MAKQYRFRFKHLDVYQQAVEHFKWTCQVVQRMPRGPFKVSDQAVGASLSIVGNIGEASGREKKWGEVQQHYRYAQGSTCEAATHLDAFAALGVIDEDEYNAAEERLARIAAMLTRLAQRQRRLAREERLRHTAAKRRTMNAAHPRTGAEGGAKRPPEIEPPPRGAAARATRAPAVEPPPRGVAEAAPAAEAIEPRPSHPTPEPQ